eukprot:scaffold119138_cov31-Tisochrysis_lutea.AAC.8
MFRGPADGRFWDIGRMLHHRARFRSDRIYTYTGSLELLALNPYAPVGRCAMLLLLIKAASVCPYSLSGMTEA